MDNIDETETATNAIVAESNIDLAIGNTTSSSDNIHQNIKNNPSREIDAPSLSTSDDIVDENNVKNPKVVQKFGEAISGKSKKILGDDMTQNEVNKMIKGEEEEVKLARRKSMDQTKRVLQIKNPTDEQQKLDLKKHLSQKAIARTGDDNVRRQSAYVVEQPIQNPKAIQQFGEASIAGRKAKQILGDDMTQEEVIKLKKSEDTEVKLARRKSMDQTKRVLQIKNPTDEQQKLDLKKHLSQKAIARTGDDNVRRQSAYVVEQPIQNPKAIQQFGEASIAGRKAKQILGDDMTQEEVIKLKKSEDEELKALRRRSVTLTKEVLKQKRPTEEQQTLELKRHLSEKIIAQTGDESVRKQSQMVVENPTNSSKVVAVLGHSKVRGNKAYKLLGSPMTDEQRKNKKNRTLSLAQPYVGSIDLANDNYSNNKNSKNNNNKIDIDSSTDKVKADK